MILQEFINKFDIRIEEININVLENYKHIKDKYQEGDKLYRYNFGLLLVRNNTIILKQPVEE